MTHRTRALFAEAWPVLAVALALSACKGDPLPLIQTTTLAAGEACAAGGTRVDVGIDEDGDGALSAAEVTSSQLVCDGEDATDGQQGTVTRTTALADGDADCPYGGLRFDAGPDDGAGGGTAGDGVLQDGEITTTEFVCNGRPEIVPSGMEPPAGPVGSFALDVSGGDGRLASGGSGGSISLQFDYGSGGGGVKVFETGEAAHAIAFPATLTANLGPVPVVVTTSRTVLLDPDTGTLSDGDLYLRSGFDTLYRWDATAGSGRIVTGLRVASGATLTLPANWNTNSRTYVSLSHDVHLSGTLTTSAGAGGKVDLSLFVGNWLGEATGSIDLTGVDGAGGRNLEIYAETSVPGTYQNGGAVFNRATLDTSGGGGSVDGGGGGSVWVEARVALYNAGTIDTSGGDGGTGEGGSAGSLGMATHFGTLFNEGGLALTGGAGGAFGGYGGEAHLAGYNLGWVVNAGDVDARGGATQVCPAAASCSGGRGGGLYVQTWGGAVVNTADVDARGGAAPLPASPTTQTSTGGTGGYLHVHQQNYGNGWWGDYTLPRDIHVSGDLRLAGGAGGAGGHGGWVQVTASPYYAANSQDVVLFGYPHIDASGGAGATSGGTAGSYAVFMSPGVDLSGQSVPGGYAVSVPDVDLSGGAGANGTGGGGGSFRLETPSDHFAEGSVVHNHGDVDLKGGRGGGAFSGGYGGEALMSGIAGVFNAGAVDARGGAGGATGSGRWGGGIRLFADQGTVDNDGALTVDGGAGAAANGGRGGTLELVGATVESGGDLHANGGAGATTSGFYGGDGGVVFLHSLWGTTQQDATSLTVAGGVGDTPGLPGEVHVDGMNVTDDWTP